MLYSLFDLSSRGNVFWSFSGGSLTVGTYEGVPQCLWKGIYCCLCAEKWKGGLLQHKNKPKPQAPEGSSAGRVSPCHTTRARNKITPQKIPRLSNAPLYLSTGAETRQQRAPLFSQSIKVKNGIHTCQHPPQTTHWWAANLDGNVFFSFSLLSQRRSALENVTFDSYSCRNTPTCTAIYKRV